jgi:hypothetical protein
LIAALMAFSDGLNGNTAEITWMMS